MAYRNRDSGPVGGHWTGNERLKHRRQTQGPRAESGPPPGFIRPGSLFLPGSSTELLAPSQLYGPEVTFGPLKATARLMWLLVTMSLMPLVEHKDSACLTINHRIGASFAFKVP